MRVDGMNREPGKKAKKFWRGVKVRASLLVTAACRYSREMEQ